MCRYPPLPALPEQRQFRIGTTSFVYPAEILPNVRSLAPVVDDIELVLFESADASNLPTPAVVSELAALGTKHDLTYTVHFPIDRALGGASAQERAAAHEAMLRIVDLTRPLSPWAWLLHLEGVRFGDTPDRVADWQHDLRALLPALIERTRNPSLLCVENLGYPFEWCDPLISEFGLGVCVDVGHLLLAGLDPAHHIRNRRDRCRVVHLHALRDGRDHLGLDKMDGAMMDSILAALADFHGVVTLEVFDFEETGRSIQTLGHAMAAMRLSESPQAPE